MNTEFRRVGIHRLDGRLLQYNGMIDLRLARIKRALIRTHSTAREQYKEALQDWPHKRYVFLMQRTSENGAWLFNVDSQTFA